jgi:hypothetical protein
MSTQSGRTAAVLPRWLIIVASLAIVFHLMSTVLRALAWPSGPWATADGMRTVPPPPFASQFYASIPGAYLAALRLAHPMHFFTTNPAQADVSFRATFKDHDGNEHTLSFPDKNANRWVQHRQRLLANGLTFDVPVNINDMEKVPPPGKEPKKVRLWKQTTAPTNPEGRMQLEDVQESLVKDLVGPNGMPPQRPSPQEMLFVNSYTRYLCRAYGADKIRIVRHYQGFIPPDILMEPKGPDQFNTIDSDYGEVTP